MPQMMPYSWVLIFFLILTSLIFLINSNYFFYMPFFNQSNFQKKKNMWTWKW